MASSSIANEQNRMSLHYQFLRNSASFLKAYRSEKLSLGSLAESYWRYVKLWYFHEMEVGEFFLYRLWRRELSEERYRSFIGWRKHIKSLVALNPIQYRCLTENKHIFYAFCKSHNLPTPEILAIYDRHQSKMDGLPILSSTDELKLFMAAKGINECIVKPAEGTRGQGILALRFNVKHDAFYRLSGEKIDDSLLEENLRGYHYRSVSQSTFLIQRRLRPHFSTMQLSKYVPFSYRVLTILKERGKGEIVEVYAKCPVGNKHTDNWENGGLTIRLDDQGICYGANDNAEYRFDVMERHPDNGFSFKGWKAPFYKEVCELGLKLSECFYLARCVAWDIIVAEDGVFVIEGNNPWSVGQQEVYDQGLWQKTFAEEAEKAISAGPQRSPWF